MADARTMSDYHDAKVWLVLSAKSALESRKGVERTYTLLYEPEKRDALTLELQDGDRDYLVRSLNRSMENAKRSFSFALVNSNLDVSYRLSVDTITHLMDDVQIMMSESTYLHKRSLDSSHTSEFLDNVRDNITKSLNSDFREVRLIVELNTDPKTGDVLPGPVIVGDCSGVEYKDRCAAPL